MDKDKRTDRSICRAKIEPSTTEGFDFQAVAVPTDNKQLMYSWRDDEYFYQVLRTGKENIKTDRLESGLPIFDNHPDIEDAGVLNLLGITNYYEFTPEGIVVRCKFGARADEPLRSDVKNGIAKTVSIEGTVLEYVIERKVGEIPIYYAELWEPESLHFAPIPQDIESQIDVKRAVQKQIEITNTPKADKSIIESLINKF